MAAGLLPELDGDTPLVINDWHFADVGSRTADLPSLP
jgi:hypothetical protein